MTEKYCFTVGNEGQASLNILEKSFIREIIMFESNIINIYGKKRETVAR